MKKQYVNLLISVMLQNEADIIQTSAVNIKDDVAKDIFAALNI